MSLFQFRKVSLVLLGVAAVLGVVAVAQATPISFSGSYDGTYQPDDAIPPAGQSTWNKVLVGTCVIVPNDDDGTPTAGVANFNDLDQSGRIQVNHPMGAGTFSADQSQDEYVYTARIKFSSEDVYGGTSTLTNRATHAFGFRDEFNGTTKGNAVYLGWFIYRQADGNQPGLWLVDGHFSDHGVKLNNVDYFDDAWHTYRVEKFIDTDTVTKVKVYVDDTQVGSAVDYSTLPEPHHSLSDLGFGWFSGTTFTEHATVDYFQYGPIPEPSTLALLATGLLGLLAYAWRKRK